MLAIYDTTVTAEVDGVRRQSHFVSTADTRSLLFAVRDDEVQKLVATAV